MQNAARRRLRFPENLEDRRVLSAISIVVDANSEPAFSGSTPAAHAPVGEDLYVVYPQLDDVRPFQSQTPFELWKFTAGEQPVLVDTIPAVGSSFSMVAAGNDLYFAVDTINAEGTQRTGSLWHYSIEGSTATELIDLSAELSATTTVVAATESALLLSTYHLTNGENELWGFTLDEQPDESDLELLLSPETSRTFASNFTTLGDEVYFEFADLAARERAIWKTDGTLDGTMEVRRDDQVIDRPDIVVLRDRPVTPGGFDLVEVNRIFVA